MIVGAVVFHILRTGFDYFFGIGNMNDIDQCFVWSMEVHIDIVFREHNILRDVVVCKSFPFSDSLILVVIGEFVKDNEYLKVRAMSAANIGSFAKHILKIVVGILRIVLHDKFDSDTCNWVPSMFYGYVNLFVDVSASDVGFSVV